MERSIERWLKFLIVILLDISSSLIDGLGDACNDFYKNILSYLTQYMDSHSVHVYLFPALRTSSYVEFIRMRRDGLDELVKEICNPKRPRGTPLIRAICNVLSFEENVRKLIIVSDLLSDRSDMPEPTDDVVARLNDIELSVVWLENRLKYDQNEEPFKFLIKKLYTKKTSYPASTLEGFGIYDLLILAQNNKVLRFTSMNIEDIRGYVDYYTSQIKGFIT